MIKLRPACFLLYILCLNYVYSDYVSPPWNPCLWSSTYTTQYTNGKQTTPQISYGEDGQISTRICSCTQNLHQRKIISLAGYDEQINHIIEDIQSQKTEKDVTIIFYLYKYGRLNYLGSLLTSLQIFEMVLRKYNHCIFINENNIHRFHEAHTGWCINDLILIPSLKESLMSNDLVTHDGNNGLNKYVDNDLTHNNLLTSESSQDNNGYQNLFGHLTNNVNNFKCYEFNMPGAKNLGSPPINVNLRSNEENHPGSYGKINVDSRNLEGYVKEISRNKWYDLQGNNNAAISNMNFGVGVTYTSPNIDVNLNRHIKTSTNDNNYYDSSNNIGSPAAVEMFNGNSYTEPQISTQISKILPSYYSISDPVNYIKTKTCKFSKPSSDLNNSYEIIKSYQSKVTDSNTKLYYFDGGRQHYTSSNINTKIPSSPAVLANFDAHNAHGKSDTYETTFAAKTTMNYNLDNTIVIPNTPIPLSNPRPYEVNINNPTSQQLKNENDFSTQNRQFNSNWQNYYLNLKPVHYKGTNINIGLVKEQRPTLTQQGALNENILFTGNHQFNNNWQNYYLNLNPVNSKDPNINIGLEKEQSPTSNQQGSLYENMLLTKNRQFNNNWQKYYLNLKPVHYKGTNINVDFNKEYKYPPIIPGLNQKYYKPALAATFIGQPKKYYTSLNNIANTLPQTNDNVPVSDTTPLEKQIQFNINKNDYAPEEGQNDYGPPTVITSLAQINNHDMLQNNVRNQNPQFDPNVFQNNYYDNQPKLISNALWPNVAQVNAKFPEYLRIPQHDNVYSIKDQNVYVPTTNTARLAKNNALDNTMFKLKPNFISQHSSQSYALPESLNKPQNLYSNARLNYNNPAVAIEPTIRLNDKDNIYKPNNQLNAEIRPASLVATISPNTGHMFSNKIQVYHIPSLQAFPSKDNYNNFDNDPTIQQPWSSYAYDFPIGTDTNIPKSQPQLYSPQGNNAYNPVPLDTPTATPFLSNDFTDMATLRNKKTYYNPMTPRKPTNIFKSYSQTEIPSVNYNMKPQQYFSSKYQPKDNMPPKNVAYIPQSTPFNLNNFWNSPNNLDGQASSDNYATFNLQEPSPPQNNKFNVPYSSDPNKHYYNGIPSYTKPDQFINPRASPDSDVRNRVSSQNIPPNTVQPIQWTRKPAVINNKLIPNVIPKTFTPPDFILPNRDPNYNNFNTRTFEPSSNMMPPMSKSFSDPNSNTLANHAPQNQPFNRFPNFKPRSISPGFESPVRAVSGPSVATYSSPKLYSKTPYSSNQSPYYNNAFETRPCVVTNGAYMDTNMNNIPNPSYKTPTQRNFADLIQLRSPSRSHNIVDPGPSIATPAPTSYSFQIPSDIPQIEPSIQSQYSPLSFTFPRSSVKSWPPSSFDPQENPLEIPRNLKAFSVPPIATWPSLTSYSFQIPSYIPQIQPYPKSKFIPQSYTSPGSSLKFSTSAGSANFVKSSIPRILSSNTLNIKSPTSQVDLSTLDPSQRPSNENKQAQALQYFSSPPFRQPYQRELISLNMIKPHSSTMSKPCRKSENLVNPSFEQQTLTDPNLIDPCLSTTNRPYSSLHTSLYPLVIRPQVDPSIDFEKLYTSPGFLTKPDSFATLKRLSPLGIRSYIQPHSSNIAYYNSPGFFKSNTASSATQIPYKPCSLQDPSTIQQVQPWTGSKDLTVPWSHSKMSTLNVKKPELLSLTSSNSDRSHYPSYMWPIPSISKYSSNFPELPILNKSPVNNWPRSYSFNFKPFMGISVPQSTILPEFATLNKKIPVTDRPNSYSLSSKLQPSFSRPAQFSNTPGIAGTSNLQSPASNSAVPNLFRPQSNTQYPNFAQPSRFAKLNAMTSKLQTTTWPYSASYDPKYSLNIAPKSENTQYSSDFDQPFALPKHAGRNLVKAELAAPVQTYLPSSAKYPSILSGQLQPKTNYFAQYYPSPEFAGRNILLTGPRSKARPFLTPNSLQTPSLLSPLNQPSNYFKGFLKSDAFPRISNLINKPPYNPPKSSSQYGAVISDFGKVYKSQEHYLQNGIKPQSTTTEWPYHTTKSSVGQTITPPIVDNYLKPYDASFKYDSPRITPSPLVLNFNNYDSYQAPINTHLKYNRQNPVRYNNMNLKNICKPFNPYSSPCDTFNTGSSKLFLYKPLINKADNNNEITQNLQYKIPISPGTNNIFPIISSSIGTGTLNFSPCALQKNQGNDYRYPYNNEFRGPLPIEFGDSSKTRNSICKPYLVDNKYTFDMSKYIPKASQFDSDVGFTSNNNVNNVKKLNPPSPNYIYWQSLSKNNQPCIIPNSYEGTTKFYPEQNHFAIDNKIHATPDSLGLTLKPFEYVQKDTTKTFPANQLNKPTASEVYKMMGFPSIWKYQALKEQSTPKSPCQYYDQSRIPYNNRETENRPFVLNKNIFNKPTSYITNTNNNIETKSMYQPQMYLQKYPQTNNYNTENTSPIKWNKPISYIPSNGDSTNTAQTPDLLNNYPEASSYYFRPCSYDPNLGSPMNGQAEYMPKLPTFSQNANPQISAYSFTKLPNQYTGVSQGYRTPLVDSPQKYPSYKATVQPSKIVYNSGIIIPSVNHLRGDKFSQSTIPKPYSLKQRFNYNNLNQPYQINANAGVMTFSPTQTTVNTKQGKSENNPLLSSNDDILNQGYTNDFNIKTYSRMNYATNKNVQNKMPQANVIKMYKQTPGTIRYSSGVTSNKYGPTSTSNLGPSLGQPPNTNYNSSYPNIICGNNYIYPRSNYNNQINIPNLSAIEINKPEIICTKPRLTAEPSYKIRISHMYSDPVTKLNPKSVQDSSSPLYPKNPYSPPKTANVARIVPFRNSYPYQSIHSISKGAASFTPCSYSISSIPDSKSTAGLSNLAFTPPSAFSSYPKSLNNVPSSNLLMPYFYPNYNAVQTSSPISTYPYNWHSYKPIIKVQNNIPKYPGSSPNSNGIVNFINQYTPFNDNNDPINDFNAERLAINNLLNYRPYNNEYQIAENLSKDKHVNVDVGNVCLVKSPESSDNACLYPTKDPRIYMKAWKTKMKIIKARVVFDETECGITHFMPIVKDPHKFDFGAVQDVVKDIVTRTYGEPVVLKGEYKIRHPYSVICNIDGTKLNPGTSILWPTLNENII